MGGDRLSSAGSVQQPALDGPVTVLLIDDTYLGARNTPLADLSVANHGSGPRHIVYRMTNPLAEGELWQSIIDQYGDRVTLCIAVADLRKQHAAIGQALSWERTASEIATAVRSRPEFSRVARTIVNVGYGGAVIVERNGGSTLIYDPFHQEGDWERQRPGFPFGIGVCIAVGAALEAATRPETPDWVAAVSSVLCASRVGVEVGHQLSVEDGRAFLRFPFEEVSATFLAGDTNETSHIAPIPEESDSRLFDHAFTRGYRVAATEIALNGDRDACRSLLVERMGAWATVDRTEIESMRSLRNIAGEYLSQPRRGRLLNLAVFGPPGSGKSFAIKQMAKQWAGGPNNLSTLEFNVSQFSAPTGLPAALQRVRDCAVEESIPLVFWDEFDTQCGGHELGWLSQFLAPMQDGTFLENESVRPSDRSGHLHLRWWHPRHHGELQIARGRNSGRESNRLSQPFAWICRYSWSKSIGRKGRNVPVVASAVAPSGSSRKGAPVVHLRSAQHRSRGNARVARCRALPARLAFNGID